MRKTLVALTGLLLGVGGCCNHGSSTGWRFEVLAPPVIMSPSIVASGAAPIGTVGLGTVQHVESQAVQLVQQGPCVTQTPVNRPMASAAPDCTLADACARIAQLEAQIRRQARPELAPMPRAVEKPHDPEE